MPVRKFRTVDEMSTEVWRRPGDPELYRVMASLWSFGARTQRSRGPAGVRRYRSIDELDAETERPYQDDRDVSSR
jgi:hypothetical protein